PLRHKMGYFGIMALVLIFLITPQAYGTWRLLPPLAYLQFPWRFVGPVVFCLGVMAAANGAWLVRLPRNSQAAALGMLCLLPLVFAIPTFYVPEWDIPTDLDTSVAAYQQEEVSGRMLGTTFTGEF